MDFKTKYDLGQIFYFPRSSKRINVETQDFNDGHRWYRDVITYLPYVKCRKIYDMDCEIDKDGNVKTRYHMVEIDKEGVVVYHSPIVIGQAVRAHYTYHDEEELDKAFSKYEIAENFANDYAIHKKRELF